MKGVHVVLLQETHSTAEIESDWRREWGGQLVLSHGSSSSAGVAVLFSRRCLPVSVETEEVVAGRLLLLGSAGANIMRLVVKLRDCTDSGDVLFVAGDWNCTVEQDRNQAQAEAAAGGPQSGGRVEDSAPRGP
uniref:Endonuclease/exonuclease/phosphatase domain-containing protein n=1 Tax=Knipowitschia caucasica TaxID=637954 RepID=A0AAV2JY17_KNICA